MPIVALSKAEGLCTRVLGSWLGPVCIGKVGWLQVFIEDEALAKKKGDKQILKTGKWSMKQLKATMAEVERRCSIQMAALDYRI
jgi:hypothetical protein